MFVCPKCKVSIELNVEVKCCDRCGYQHEHISGIPILVADRASIEGQIEEARLKGKAEWYEEQQEVQFSGPYRHHFRKRISYLRGVMEKLVDVGDQPIKGLDLGCGDGNNLKWLGDYIGDLYGSDYNIVRLGRAAKIDVVKKVFMADVLDYPTEDNVFDVILFNHVLEHIPDAEAAMKEVRRILKPSGTLILGVPNEGVAWWQLAYKLEPRIRQTTDHVHFFTPESLERLCISSGFDVVEKKFLGWGVPHWTLDCMVRGFKILDDTFELIGRKFAPRQASSLYYILKKK